MLSRLELNQSQYKIFRYLYDLPIIFYVLSKASTKLLLDKSYYWKQVFSSLIFYNSPVLTITRLLIVMVEKMKN